GRRLSRRRGTRGLRAPPCRPSCPLRWVQRRRGEAASSADQHRTSVALDALTSHEFSHHVTARLALDALTSHYHVRFNSLRTSAREIRLTTGRPCGQKYGVAVSARSFTRRSISSWASGVFALIAARPATKASARSTVGSPTFGPARSSTAASIT